MQLYCERQLSLRSSSAFLELNSSWKGRLEARDLLVWSDLGIIGSGYLIILNTYDIHLKIEPEAGLSSI